VALLHEQGLKKIYGSADSFGTRVAAGGGAEGKRRGVLTTARWGGASSHPSSKRLVAALNKRQPLSSVAFDCDPTSSDGGGEGVYIAEGEGAAMGERWSELVAVGGVLRF